MNEEIKKRIGAIRNGMVPDGYVRTDYGVFPSHWRLAELSEIAHPLTETAGTRKIETVSISSGVGFVNQAEKFGKELSGKQYEKYIVLHRGDFSYNKGNSNLYPQGCIYRLNDREIAAVPNVFESFRIVNGDPDYYEQLFLSGFLNHQLFRKINHGVRDDGLLNLTDTDFYSCVLPVPPIEEQHRIAEILSACDRMLALHQETLSEAKEMKKSLLNKMFPKDGACYPKLRFAGFTSAWEQRKLSDITSKIGSGKTPLGGNSAYVEDGICLIRSQNVYDNKVDLSDVVFIDEETNSSMSNSRVVVGDVLLNITGASLGRSAVYTESKSANVNQHVCIIRPVEGYESAFIQLNIASTDGQKQIDASQAGGGREGLNFQQIGKIEFMFPKIDEQKKVGEYLSNFDNLINLHRREIELQQNKKKALMQLLLTGVVPIS